jgi:glycosyltransferase involved in cell wall biosynthesis
MNVLALSSYPIEAASTRYRVIQFIKPLSEKGISLTVRPFLDSELQASLYNRAAWPRTAFGLLRAALRRFGSIARAQQADVLFVQREAMILGPPIFEWLAARVLKRPMVLDLDDATYVSYTSPTYGRLGKALKWPGKTDVLIRWATSVTCGNRALAEYVSSKGTRAHVIPTVVDTEVFCPVVKNERQPRELVLGWVGTHSTFPYLQSIFPVLQELARQYKFRLKVVGAGTKEINIPGVLVENLEWKLEREVSDFQSFDIGLYPISASFYPNEWAAGKSGFKAIQYMAVGIPYVATPIGAIAEIGEVGTTHFCASTNEEWRAALTLLITDRERCEMMGSAGREHAIEHFGLAAQADKLAAALRDAAAERMLSER